MATPEGDLVDGALTNRVIAAFYEVYNTLKPGYLGSVYQRALAIELRAAGIHAVMEAPLTVRYKGTPVGDYRVDLLVEDRVVVELKATTQLHPRARAQLTNLLRGTETAVGLLLHFGEKAGVVRVDNPIRKA